MVKHESSFKTKLLTFVSFFSGKTQGLFWIYYVTQSFSREIPEILNFEQHKTQKLTIEWSLSSALSDSWRLNSRKE